MRTVRIGIEETLLRQVDRAVRKLGTSRSAFVRSALRDAVERIDTADREIEHRHGYEANPVRRGEFDCWLAAQAWPSYRP